MSLLTMSQTRQYEATCEKILAKNDADFVGIVNEKGRIVVKVCGKNFSSFEKNALDMFLMETAIEFSMKNEFNKKFGPIEYVISKRHHFNICCMPNRSTIVAIITAAKSDPCEVAKNASQILQEQAGECHESL